MELLYEGKAKKLFRGPHKGTIIQYFKDDATAFNAQKKDIVPGKGIINNYISSSIFQSINQTNIPAIAITILIIGSPISSEIKNPTTPADGIIYPKPDLMSLAIELPHI